MPLGKNNLRDRPDFRLPAWWSGIMPVAANTRDPPYRHS
ncbi:hypothetical protein BRUCa_3290 [Brucella melitensis]|nr:hypothetical protein BM28_B1129 [Brucella melitensis M28]ADZ89242.1 hypothetical protein BM590_B1125 [Brucella melitensis M5-90]AEW16013.1 hypothetical protein BCA52141_II1344 [Brucella canis HSK A52141]AEW18633.1 hypothetical protein BAA13334_II00119 [Brucella abortus A13334]AIB20016.1 Hypothetical protein BSSP3_II1346 [Brucella suis bv. 2]